MNQRNLKYHQKNYFFDDINKIAASEGDVYLSLGGSISIFSDKINANFDKINNTLITAHEWEC